MGESLTALFLQNPELANAIRRRQEGAAIMQGGMDTSPIRSPWQGLSRLAQALVGGYEQGQADKDIRDIGTKSQDEIKGALAKVGDILGGGAPQQPAPAAAPAQPAAAMPAYGSPELMGLVTPSAQARGVPLSLAMGLFKQESGGNPNAVGDGGRSVGLGQIQAATAANPGYGVAPMDPARRTDPRANIDFALDYLVGKARAHGITDLSNPAQQDAALRLYNGGGDPNYVQNVRTQMGQPAQAGGAAPTGLSAPSVRQGFGVMNVGQQLLLSGNPQAQRLGQALIAQGQSLTQLDSFRATPDGNQVNTRTGQISYAPTPRMQQGPDGTLYAVRPGGGIDVVAPGGANPGVNADANAQRALASNPPDSPAYRQAYDHLYGERTEMTPSGPVTYRPRTPPAGLAAPVVTGGAAGGATATPPRPGVTYATPVQPNVEVAKRVGVPLADSNPYEGMAAADQQKAKTAALADVRDRNAKRDDADQQADEVALNLKRFKELNKTSTTGPIYGLPGAKTVGSFSAPIQEMQAISSKITPMARAVGSGSTSDFDAKMMGQATVGVEKHREVNNNIADAQLLMLENRQAKKAFTEAYVEANGHEQGAERMWRMYLEANPIFDPKQEATYGLNKDRVDWKTWFKNAVDPQTGQMRAPTAPTMKFDRNGNLVSGG